MIESFRHRGLRRLYEHGDGSKVRADQLSRISDVLAHLDRAQAPGDLDLPRLSTPPVEGRVEGLLVTISGNWRIVFRFADGEACDVDLSDYH